MANHSDLPIDPDHLPAVIDMLRADGVAYLNVGWSGINGPEGAASPEWRTLADAVCETCDGGGDVAMDDGPMQWVKDCSDCRGTGKPTHTLTGECPCGGTDTGLMRSGRCHLCFGTGTVSVDVVVAELLPVYDFRAWKSSATPGRRALTFVLVRDDPPAVFVTPDTMSDITPLGPPLQPGDWVAVLRRVHD